MNAQGILTDDDIAALVEAGGVLLEREAEADQLQPASLDVRLGATAYRLRASFLPGPERTVAQRLAEPGLVMHEMPLATGAVLEPGCVYLAPLLENLALEPDVAVRANPKSSTGRLDVFTRVITDRGVEFDTAPAGYHGPLYLEISPRTFSVVARTGDRLAQLRFVTHPAPDPLRTQTLSVALADMPHGLVGYRAKRHATVIDLAKVGQHDPHDYWEPITARDGRLILDPGEFYILASKEAVAIGSDEAAEMAPIVAEIGEFRAHYAGFFDPGFGIGEGVGGRAVLEVRGRDVPFILEDGQAAARLVFERLTRPPRRLYGAAGSHYQGQGLALAKHFSAWK